MSFQLRLPKKIILRAKNGDKFAISHIYHEYKSPIYSLAYRILQDRDAAEDVLQQVIEKVILKIHELKALDKFNGWLKTLSYRVTIDYLSQNSKYSEFNENNQHERSDELNISSLDIEKYLAILNPRERIVVVFFLVEGFKHKEIAYKLDISEANSKQVYKRALGKLKKLVEKSAFGGISECKA